MLRATTFRPRPVSDTIGHADPASALAAAGGVASSDPASPLVVVVNDPDRATDSAAALRAIRAAVGARTIRVVVATGSHRWSADARAAHEAPLRDAVGAPSEFRWHVGDDATHVAVGPARLDVVVADARDVVGVGSVEPHWFAGLTGAHKTLTVGVMHRDDIATNHALAMSDAARPFRLSGNPVHEGFVRVLEALTATRRVTSLQHVGPRWFAGPPLDALAAAAPGAQARWLHRADRPFDWLVAVVEPPLSRTLYQAEKGVKNNEAAVKDRGVLILDAECADGVGPDRFFEMLLAAPDAMATRAAIERHGYRLGDHKAHRLRTLQGRGVRIGVISASFPRSLAMRVGIDVYETRGFAAAALQREFGANGQGAVVEDAGHSVVVLS